MQPASSGFDQNTIKSTLSLPAQKLIETIERKLYSAASLKNAEAQQLQNKKVEPLQKQFSSFKEDKPPHLIQQAQSHRGMPDLLNNNKTIETRERQALLKTTIQSTIHQLLRACKANKNQSLGEQQQQGIKNQVFDRFAFIFSQMNELKGDIETTIGFLNQSGNSSIDRHNTPIKGIDLPNAKISEHSHSYEQESMREQNSQKNIEQPISPNHGHNSIEERFHCKANQNSMESQE